MNKYWEHMRSWCRLCHPQLFSCLTHPIQTVLSYLAHSAHSAFLDLFQTWTPSACSTHPAVFRLIILISISLCNAAHGFALVLALAGLLFLSIHLISIILHHSYDYCRHIMSTISRFSWVLPSVIRQLYSDLELVQKIIGSNLILRIFSVVDLIIILTSNSWIIT